LLWEGEDGIEVREEDADEGVDGGAGEGVCHFESGHVQVIKGHEPEVRCGVSQLLLDRVDEVADFEGGSRPEDEAVARIDEVGVAVGAVELDEVVVKDPAWEGFGEDEGLLLRVARAAVDLVAGLELLLRCGSGVMIGDRGEKVRPYRNIVCCVD